MRNFFRSIFALLVLVAALPAFADLHDPANSADYLIVTPAAVIQANPWITQLADWRNAHGRTLKDFLFYAYRHWSPPRLKDVFIVGWHDAVPSHIQPDSVVSYHDSTGDHWAHYSSVSDFFYSTDPDSDNHFPLFSIGRLPWDPDSGALWNYYQKVVAYESQTDQEWQRRVQLVADSASDFDFWQDYAEPIANEIQPGYVIERDYLAVPPDNPWHTDRGDIIDDMNAGNYLMVYCGHGGAGIWSATLLLSSLTFDSLTNSPRLPIITASCYDAGMNGNYVLGPIAQSLISNSNGGAIGYLATTDLGWLFAGLQFRTILTRLATSDSVQTLGDIWRTTETEYIRANPGNPWYPATPVEMTIVGCMLLGDPGVRLPARPQTVTQKLGLYPSSLSLSSFPNPFNALTRIQFELNREMNVRLRVMNILGQEVTTLVDGHLPAGSHAIAWNAQDAPSGLYFAVLETAGARHVTKMMLLK